jgi:hypothetical protein
MLAPLFRGHLQAFCKSMLGLCYRRRPKALLSAVLLAAVPGVLGGAASLQARDLPRDKDRWLEVKTANFRLWSDAGERRTRAVGAELEQLRSGMAHLVPGLTVLSPCPTYVYVFKDRFAFSPYLFHFQGKRVENLAGYILGEPWGIYMAIDGDPRTDALHSIRHEYVHHLLHNNYAHLPLWLDEGLAEFYGALHMVDGEELVGDPVVEHIRWLRENQIIPLRQLFALDQHSKDYHEGVRQGVFYAESWALKLAPERADAWALLGLALLSVDPASQRATTALETAQRLLPVRSDVTLNLALAYARQGKRQEAAAMTERARAMGGSREDLERPGEELLLADRNEAGKLVAAGQLEAAIPILERVGAATNRKDLAELVAADLGHLRAALARQKFVAAYNQAVEVANHGETAAAIGRLQELLATNPEPTDAAQARQLLEQLQARRKRH